MMLVLLRAWLAFGCMLLRYYAMTLPPPTSTKIYCKPDEFVCSKSETAEKQFIIIVKSENKLRERR